MNIKWEQNYSVKKAPGSPSISLIDPDGADTQMLKIQLARLRLTTVWIQCLHCFPKTGRQFHTMWQNILNVKVYQWRFIFFQMVCCIFWCSGVSPLQINTVATSIQKEFEVNPYLPSGPVHPYQLDESISSFKGAWCTFSFLIHFLIASFARPAKQFWKKLALW